MNLVIIDYGLGNLFSVQKAFECAGAKPHLSNKAEDILKASHLVLPGVGAFYDGIKGLKDLNLDQAIVSYAKSNRPLLGICLGMQMFFEESNEFGLHKGLGIIPGKVIRIPDTTANGEPHKIPHIGWNNLEHPANQDSKRWADTPLQKIQEKSSVYFVHSYTGQPTDSQHRLADTYYNGRLILAAVQKDKTFGCQFHPEKSSKVGISILNNFCSMR